MKFIFEHISADDKMIDEINSIANGQFEYYYVRMNGRMNEWMETELSKELTHL